MLALEAGNISKRALKGLRLPLFLLFDPLKDRQHICDATYDVAARDLGLYVALMRLGASR